MAIEFDKENPDRALQPFLGNGIRDRPGILVKTNLSKRRKGVPRAPGICNFEGFEQIFKGFEQLVVTPKGLIFGGRVPALRNNAGPSILGAGPGIKPWESRASVVPLFFRRAGGPLPAAL